MEIIKPGERMKEINEGLKLKKEKKKIKRIFQNVGLNERDRNRKRKDGRHRQSSWQVQYVTNIRRVLERIEKAEGTRAPANGPEP